MLGEAASTLPLGRMGDGGEKFTSVAANRRDASSACAPDETELDTGTLPCAKGLTPP